MERKIEIKDGDHLCGTVTITLVEDGASHAAEQKKGDVGSMVFEFTPAKKDDKQEDKKECCGGKGAAWIQHARLSPTQDWSYDNGTKKPGKGGDSDPDKKPQPTKPGDKGYTTKPWYGSPYGKKSKEEQEKFAKDPEPQSTIGDLPGGACEYRTQLVCIDSGTVMLD